MSSECVFVFLKHTQFKVLFVDFWIIGGSIMDQKINYKTRKYPTLIPLKNLF